MGTEGIAGSEGLSIGSYRLPTNGEVAARQEQLKKERPEEWYIEKQGYDASRARSRAVTRGTLRNDTDGELWNAVVARAEEEATAHTMWYFEVELRNELARCAINAADAKYKEVWQELTKVVEAKGLPTPKFAKQEKEYLMGDALSLLNVVKSEEFPTTEEMMLPPAPRPEKKPNIIGSAMLVMGCVTSMQGIIGMMIVPDPFASMMTTVIGVGLLGIGYLVRRFL